MEPTESAVFEEVYFHGSALLVTVLPDGSRWVGITEVCAAIGIKGGGQRSKLMRDERFTPTGICRAGADGKTYKVLCLNLRQFAVWLLGVQPRNIVLKDNEEEQARRRAVLVQFQEECMDVLYLHFSKKEGSGANKGILEVTLQGFEHSLRVAYEARDRADHALNVATEARDDVGRLKKTFASSAGKVLNVAKHRIN